MSVDIFNFWADVPPNARVHPADKPILDRSPHSFDLRCLPSNIDGPLRTARVVLLYLSPGMDERDVEEADWPESQRKYADRRAGHAPLRRPDDHNRGHAWWAARIKRLGPWQELQHRVAVLNIGPYHSQRFTDYPMLAALPSCRVALDWAHTVLFPQAEVGERVVICLRAAPYWGLGAKGRYGEGLFAPNVTRGGHMLGTGDDMAARDDVVAAARATLARGPLAG
ncbi:hypothetical protein [Methylobacterium sp. SI9]|uniref:hypothetical protein n=1 Tax=Methylobacterium guangdongense TaxID=3138811 RepID=UPI00313B44D2